MLSLLKSMGLINGLISLITISLIVFKASWPLAVVMIVLGAMKAFNDYLLSKKKEIVDQSVKDKVTAIENKIAMMGLRK